MRGSISDENGSGSQTLRIAVLPDAVLLLGGYAAARVISTLLLLGAAAIVAGHSPFVHADGPAGFLGLLQSWDGRYYGIIADHGYPVQLPNTDGVVAKNAWAFLPLFPLIARVVMLTGLGFDVSGPLVALVFGAAATLALHRVLRPLGRRRALWGALLFAVGPMSFVLQVPYAESVFLFFMFASLAAVQERRYLLVIPLGVAAAFAHPGALALSLVLAIRFLREKRILAVVAAGVIGVAGIAWPFVAGAVTGVPNAYLETETAWWRDYLGQVSFVPFTPWFVFSNHYWGVYGVLLVVAVLVAFVWWMRRPTVRSLGTHITDYTLSYAAYLVAVFLPQQSLFRMLLPLSPLLCHPALSATRSRRTVVIVTAVTLQPVGILLFWVIWPP